MSKYDGLIIPRSYSEYLNKTDSATLSQMLQHLTGLWSHAVSAGDQKPVTSDAVNSALTDAATIQQALQLPGVLSETVAAGDNKAVTSDAVNSALTDAVNSALTNYVSFRKLSLENDLQGDILEIDNKQLKIVTYTGLIRSQIQLGEVVALNVKIPAVTISTDVLTFGYVAGNSNGRVLVRGINNTHIELDHGNCNFVITYSYR